MTNEKILEKVYKKYVNTKRKLNGFHYPSLKNKYIGFSFEKIRPIRASSLYDEEYNVVLLFKVKINEKLLNNKEYMLLKILVIDIDKDVYDITEANQPRKMGNKYFELEPFLEHISHDNFFHYDLIKLFGKYVYSRDKVKDLSDVNLYKFLTDNEFENKSAEDIEIVNELNSNYNFNNDINFPDEINSTYKYCKLEKINNDWWVIRCFDSVPDYSTRTNEIKFNSFEIVRLYCSRDKIIPTAKTVNKKYICRKFINIYPLEYKIIAENNVFEDFINNTKMKYIKDIFYEVEPNQQLNLIYSNYMNNDIEKLYHAGFNYVIKLIATKCDMNSSNSDIMLLMGPCIEEKTNIFNRYGITFYQANKILETKKKLDDMGITDAFTIVYEMRYIFGLDDNLSIMDIDASTFDDILEIMFILYSNRIHIDKKMLVTIVKYYYNRAGIKKGLKLFLSILNKNATSEILIMLKDTINIAKENNIKILNFKNINELELIHNDLILMDNQKRKKMNLKQIEEEKEIYNKLKEKWKKWEYKGTEFSIIYPENSLDIINEGYTLTHCVKTYINSVKKSNTNILFLRKTNQLETPFFTIELSNEGRIRQVHGYHNCNIDTNPSAELFLKEWIKEKQLSYENYDERLAVYREV